MASKGNIEMDVVVEDQTSVGLASAQKKYRQLYYKKR